MSRKIGFWSLLSLVLGSQIGSGILILPANLAPFGFFGFLGWVISGIGAIALALVFAKLSTDFPQTGGPHVYVQQAFGKQAAFWTGWTYWVISWVSSTAVIVATIGYLSPLLGPFSPIQTLALQILLLFLIAGLNFLGVHRAGRSEFVLTLIKLIALVFLPIWVLFQFNAHNIELSPSLTDTPLIRLISQVVLLTLWGFIGLESGTTAAGSIENPSQTIPRAVIIGTAIVAIIYLINSLAILGAMPASKLAQSKAPYADVAQYLLGGQWHLGISLMAALMCIGTLNAWVLASSQVALGLSQDALVPSFFGKTNRYQAPYIALIISTLGIIPLLILTTHTTLTTQLATIIDFSVTAFLYVYVMCTLAFLMKNRGLVQWSYGLIALTFCLWILSQSSLETLAIATLFGLSGILIKPFVR